ncbi:MAG: PaaI family thioesterase [Syntrophomonas sp.]
MVRYTSLEQMAQKYHFPSVKHPQCREVMQPEFVEYVEGESLTYKFPVLEMYANPRNSMQGGFIGAAFDNTFGGLVYLMTGRLEMASIDMYVNFHRPIFVGDNLYMKAIKKSMGRTVVHMLGEAWDGKEHLIATATTNIMLLGNDKFEGRK